MSGLDVEALLDSTANAAVAPDPKASSHRSPDRDDRHKSERSERRDRDRHRDGSRDRDRDRKRRERSRDRERERERSRRERDGEVPNDDDARSPKSEGRSANGSMKSSRRRSRSRDGERRHSHRDKHRDSIDMDDSYRGSGAGDYYRGSGRGRDRSKTPDGDRYYRPSGRSRRDRDDRGDARERDWDRHDDRGARGRDGRRRTPSPRRDKSRSGSPQLTEDERDRRTVFVQQLAARLRTKELIAFFEKVGPVKEAQIVKDRVSGRSKGYE